ncbi:lipid droplet-associated hydrolase isoform X2 [Neofelis nebulosa]|uniref:lipid droplet-associated hydrolase isoform X2 n=1 Tax=Neofelis nebulosa TaxID=61452 RepID=UPI00272B6EC9|nr:lipid droplet-associated hydrolase isoform X2 [Neofelis nebulosa]
MDSSIKEEVPVHEEFILCCGVETQVLKCGPWTNLFNEQRANRPKLLIFIITDSNAQEIKDIYGLQGQVEHKLAFLRTHVPKEMKLVVIGHSIGCYISLEILKLAPELPIIRSFLLFPTIERLSESPNGRIATPLLCWLRYALYVFGYLLLKPWPEKIRSLITRIGLQMMNVQYEFSVLNILEPFCLANVVYLGGQEMMKVVERDNETIRAHLSKLTFYYGTMDAWCPTKYYEDIKKDFPEGDIRLCEKKLPHAFIIHFYGEMAGMIADWLKDDLSKIEALTHGSVTDS